MSNLRDLVIEHINDLPEDEIIALHNRYIDENSYEENIYQMDELDGMLSEREPSEIIKMLGDFSLNHDYFYFDGSGNLNSFDYINESSSPVDVEELADWLIKNDLLDELEGFCQDEEEEDEEE